MGEHDQFAPAAWSRRGILPVMTAILTAPTLARAEPPPEGLMGAGPSIVLERGAYRVAVDTSTTAHVIVLPGATIEVASGCRLTLLGGFSAPLLRVFSGEGTVDLNRARILEAYPEWWGANSWDAAVDSLPALSACLAAHPVMRLSVGDYHVGDCWKINRPFVRISGAGFRGTTAGAGTRIVTDRPDRDVLRVGPAVMPRSVNEFTSGIVIRGLALVRSQAVAQGPSGPGAGLRAQYLLYARFEEISAFEHDLGFVAQGLVRSHLINCVAFRSLPGATAGVPWRAFLLDGTGAIGLAGGNASLYLINCNASIGGTPQATDPVGLSIEGAFADTFINRFEATGVATGIRVDGRTSTLGARAVAGHSNLHIERPVIDQCSTVGIEIADAGDHALIDLSDPYVASAPGALAGIYLKKMRGAMTISGGQLIGRDDASAGGKACGFLAEQSKGVQIFGLKVSDHARPVVLANCSEVRAVINVLNPGHATSMAAIALDACTGIALEPWVTGLTDAFPVAIDVTRAAPGSRIAVNATGIEGGCLAVGAPKVRIDGAAALAASGKASGVTVDGAS